MIKDYYNKYQNNEILNREDKKEEQDILTNINSKYYYWYELYMKA